MIKQWRGIPRIGKSPATRAANAAKTPLFFT